MIKNLFLIFGMFFNLISFSYAIPAHTIKLEYDLDSQILILDAKHPTERPDKYYIRKVEVIVNSSEPQIFFYTKQDLPVKFSDEYHIKAEAGDHIDVQLYSSEGGLAKASLDIPKKNLEEKDDNEQKTIQNRE